jgi:hypothetical protein
MCDAPWYGARPAECVETPPSQSHRTRPKLLVIYARGCLLPNSEPRTLGRSTLFSNFCYGRVWAVDPRDMTQLGTYNQRFSWGAPGSCPFSTHFVEKNKAPAPKGEVSQNELPTAAYGRSPPPTTKPGQPKGNSGSETSELALKNSKIQIPTAILAASQVMGATIGCFRPGEPK